MSLILDEISYNSFIDTTLIQFSVLLCAGLIYEIKNREIKRLAKLLCIIPAILNIIFINLIEEFLFNNYHIGPIKFYHHRYSFYFRSFVLLLCFGIEILLIVFYIKWLVLFLV